MNMRKWSLFLACYFCVCLLVGCTYHEGTNGPTPQKTEEEGGTTATCRVISQTDSGTLVLADRDSAGGVYTISLDDKTLTLDGEAFDPAEPGAYQALPGGSLAGTMVTVAFDGGIQESWPMGFSGATALDFSTADFDDTCRLYLDVLEDLWEVDGGLNENIAELGLDLSQTRLSESEQSAVAYVFGTAHNLMAMEGTYQDFVDQGYIDGENFIWEDGCLFSIEESDEPVIFNEAAMGSMTTGSVHEGIRFDAEKWRSGLGAYFFMDCTAGRAAGGAWGPYTVGAEAIS